MKTGLTQSDKRGFPHAKIWNQWHDHYLDITYVQDKYCKIRGSIRKWYLGGSSIQDLNYVSLQECLHRLANELEISYNDLLSGKVMKVEFGSCIQVPFEPKTLLSMFLYQPRLKEFNLRRYSKRFEGKYYNLSFYDKLQEMKDHGLGKQISGLVKNGMKVLRYEIQFKKAGSNNLLKASHISEIGDLLLSYQSLLETWLKCYTTLSVIQTKEKVTMTSMTYKDVKKMKKDFYYLGILGIGIDNFLCIINNSEFSKGAKSKLRRELKIGVSEIGSSIIGIFTNRIKRVYFQQLNLHKMNYNKPIVI